MRKRFLAMFAFFALLAPMLALHAAPRYRASESELKSTFIYNFALFTAWPAAAFPEPDSPLVIGIVGEDPSGPDLDKLAAIKKARERPLKVVRVPNGGAPPECHILFLATSERSRLRELIQAVKGKPVLTVSDVEGFCDLGGCVRFSKFDKTVGLFINPGAALAQGLRLSPELLAIGTIRKTNKNVEPK